MSIAQEITGGIGVLHADASLVVVDKPSGLLSVPGRGENRYDSLASRVQVNYPDALIVHRLDMETSGLLVLARGKEAHRRLSMAFERRQVHKKYVAVVSGQVAMDQGMIDLPLICDWPNRPRQMVDFTAGKPSRTHYRVLSRCSSHSRLALRPETGRSHQLRVHLQAIGHPILGDALYADQCARSMADRLLLHAEELGFTHPMSGESMLFRCAPPF